MQIQIKQTHKIKIKILKTLGTASYKYQSFSFSDPVKPEQSEISRQPLKCHFASVACNGSTADKKKDLFSDMIKRATLHGR
jgi:hypothetical protein